MRFWRGNPLNPVSVHHLGQRAGVVRETETQTVRPLRMSASPHLLSPISNGGPTQHDSSSHLILLVDSFHFFLFLVFSSFLVATPMHDLPSAFQPLQSVESKSKNNTSPISRGLGSVELDLDHNRLDFNSNGTGVRRVVSWSSNGAIRGDP